MKSLTLMVFIVLTFLAGTAEARRSCKADLTNTNRTGDTGVPKIVTCHTCRSVTGNPQDFRNFVYNWLVRGETGPPTGHDAYTRQNHVGSVLHENPQRISNSVCDRLGQCATTHVLTHHRELVKGLGQIVSAGISRVQVQIQDYDGDIDSSGTFYPGQSALPVPTNTVRDPKIASDQPCRNSDGNPRPGRWDTIGGGSGQSWHTHPWLWTGGTLPVRRCGYSILDRGERRRSCGWF